MNYLKNTETTPIVNFFNHWILNLSIRNNSEHIRLNGLSSGGNRKPFANFKYRKQWWIVDGDKWIEKINIAYNLMLKGQDSSIIKETASKKTRAFDSLTAEETQKPIHIFSVVMM